MPGYLHCYRFAERLHISESTVGRLLDIARGPLQPEPEPLLNAVEQSEPPPKLVMSENSQPDTYTARVTQLVREGLSYSNAMDKVLESEAS